MAFDRSGRSFADFRLRVIASKIISRHEVKMISHMREILISGIDRPGMITLVLAPLIVQYQAKQQVLLKKSLNAAGDDILHGSCWTFRVERQHLIQTRTGFTGNSLLSLDDAPIVSNSTVY